MTRTSIFLLLVCTFPLFAQPQWESGRPIPIGSPNRLGTLAVGLTSYPVGHARMTGAQGADLFAVAGGQSSPVGLFLYPWKATSGKGVPIFGQRWTIEYPRTGDQPPVCTVVESRGAVWGFFLQADEVVQARFDKQRRAMVEVRRIPLRQSGDRQRNPETETAFQDCEACPRFADLPQRPQAIAASHQQDGRWRFILSVSDGKGFRPPGPNWREQGHMPFDGAGIWRGGMARYSLWEMVEGEPAKLVSRPGEEILWSAGTLSFLTLGPQHRDDVVAGSWFGDIYYYRSGSASAPRLEPRRHAVGEDGIVLRHPLAGTYPLGYPRPGSGATDIIAGGEGALFYYAFTGRFDAQGHPVFRKPVPVLEENARLFAGSLPVPSIVDWDGDGALDVVAGNSEGRVLFFRNLGSNRLPAMAPGMALNAGGREIHVQPGYKGDIQGPGEARWGYVSPNVFDWNGDGLPDIIASDSTARNYVFLNVGSRRAPRLGFDRTLYLDALDLHGAWRVRPGVGKMGDRVAYLALDDDDQFHLYWRLDDFNLADGGKLRMEDNSPITANYQSAGGTGRTKFELVDWNDDGRVDLLVGTSKHHTIPDPQRGLPKAAGVPKAAVLLLLNTGSNHEPRYRFPVLLRHEGQPIYLGDHEIGVTSGALGPGAGRNLIVSREDGRLFFFRGEDLSPR